MHAEPAEGVHLLLAGESQDDHADRHACRPKDGKEHVGVTLVGMWARSIESTAAVDPTSNWPQLIGGCIIGPRLGQVTVDHELSYDVLIADEIELGGFIC